ncbi:pHP domain protein [Clostridium sp. CAG:492]|nr:pHP domain protein [Clostridium sp. CAG:492]
MIDMHMHTTYSDGADSLIEVLKKAESLKLEYISITDHDTCEGYKELAKLDVKKYFSGQIINGVEIKCAYKKRLIEILGYKVDPKVINNFMEEFHKTKSKEILQQKYFDILHERCKDMGLVMSKKEDIEFNPKTDWASIKIYNDIKAHEENKLKVPDDFWSEFNIFSKKYCGDVNYPLYIDKSEDYLQLDEAIKLVKDAGGLVFLPHIFIYKWAEDKKKLLDNIVAEYDIDGIECMHSEFSQDDIDYLLEYTQKNNFYRSGGSDYHGKNKVGIEMAVGKGNLKIESYLIQDWVNK